MLEIIIGSFVFLLDQAIKLLIVSQFSFGETFPIIKNIFHITYVTNTGVAFGLFGGSNWLILAFLLIIAGIFFYFRKEFIKYYNYNKNKMIFRIAIGFFLGGALGNIIDRIFRGHVVDFLDFQIWPVFNIADSFICISVLLIVFGFKNDQHPVAKE